MIQIPFDPNVHLGPITLAWHGIFTAVGIFFGVWLPLRLLRGKIKEDDGWAVATWGVVGGIVGARLVHVIDQLPYYLAHPEQIVLIWTGGIAIWGAAIGGVLGGFIAAVRRGVPIGYSADAAAPGIALGFAIGRIGDIINGEHHGTACTPPAGICVGFTHPDTLGQGPSFSDGRFSADPVHLVVAYDMAWNLFGVALTLWLRRFIGRWPDGLIFWIWAIHYAIGRFFLGFMRIGDPSYAFSLRQDQVIGLLVAAAAVPMIVRLTSRGRTHSRSFAV
ncbi:MAG: prolipoprotein diacylglyceryl transferase [Candidatus Limnocylindria bacterium]